MLIFGFNQFNDGHQILRLMCIRRNVDRHDQFYGNLDEGDAIFELMFIYEHNCFHDQMYITPLAYMGFQGFDVKIRYNFNFHDIYNFQEMDKT